MLLNESNKKLHISNLGYKTFLLVAFVVFVLINIFKAKAADLADENRYALRVETGVQNRPAEIGTFIITYRSGDVIRRHYINPKEGDYTNSISLTSNNASNKDLYKNRFSEFDNVLGYYYNWYNGKFPTDPLQQGSMDTYFFTTEYKVDEIISIGVMSDESDSPSKTWQCHGLSLYKVSKIVGKVPYGYLSSTFELGFEGTCIAEMRYTNREDYKGIAADFTLDKNDVKFLYPDKETMVSDNTKASLVFKNEPFTNVNPNKDIYTFKVDIADVYMAGFESFIAKDKSSAKVGDIYPAELLILDLTYETTSNSIRRVKIPVIMSSLAYAMERGAITFDSYIADILAQGNSIAFEARLPEFSSVYSAVLYYTSSDKEGNTSVYGLSDLNAKAYPNETNQHDKFFKAAANDAISISGIQIYQGGLAVDITQGDTAGIIVTEAAGAKMLYRADSPTFNGYTLLSGGNQKLVFEKPSSNRVRKDNRNLFLFEAKTSSLASSGTKSDIFATVYYLDNDDNEREYEFYFKEKAKEFYGYWPDAASSEAFYELCMSNSGVYYALLEIENAKKITGISLENKGKDDWMASNLSIYHIEDNSKIGGIIYKWNENNDVIKVLHGRSINGYILDEQTDLKALLPSGSDSALALISSIGFEDEINPDKGSGIYIGGEKDRVVSFISDEVGKQKDSRTDFFKYMHNMPYEIALTNFGFSSKKIEYTIDVQVGSDPYGLVKDDNKFDDCGSNNYFYFQLIFENGNSAYVQANQQMRSDGFRSGKDETFKICVNQDYGALTAISIIPEVDPNKGTPYDKLNIKKITVTRDKANGLAQTYETGEIGWIGIDYTDNGGEVKYHRENKIAKVYPFVSEHNTANLLFTIGYDSIPAGLSQFEGTVNATVNVRKTDGTVESKDFDVVKAMHSFNGTYGDNSDRTTKDGQEKLKLSDPNIMFRPNHSDRFMLQLSDVKYVEDITFEAFNKSGKKVYLKVTNVSIRVLKNADIDDNRTINNAGEYIIENMVADSNNVIMSVEDDYSATIDADTSGRIYIKFDNDDSTCISTPDETTFPYIVKRQPDSAKDTMNIYAYVSSDTKDVSKYRVTGVVNYDDKLGENKDAPDVFSLSTIIDENGVSRQVFCADNVQVKDYATLKSISLLAKGDGEGVKIDYIVLQHIKNNVVIDSYKADFPVGAVNIDDIAQTANRITAYNTVPGYQEVIIQFGEDMNDMTLIPGQRDVAISLDYLFGNTNQEYHTENYFISDSDIGQIGPGQVVKLRLYNTNIGKINGVSIASTDYLKSDIDAITIGVYSPDKEDEGTNVTYSCTDWYSVECNAIVYNETKEFKISSTEMDSIDTWSPISMKIKTMASYVAENGSFGADLGLPNNCSIMMVIAYEEAGEVKELSFNDITRLLDSGDFDAGDTAEITFLAKNLRPENIKKVSFMPYDESEESHIIWGLDSLSISFGDGIKAKTMYIEPRKILYEENGLTAASFTKVLLSANVGQVDVKFDEKNIFKVNEATLIKNVASVKQDSNSKIILENHEDKNVYRVDINVQNSSMKYIVQPGNGVVSYKSDDEELYFSIEGNVGDDRVIRIVSEENTESFIDLTFTIKTKVEEAVPEDSSKADDLDNVSEETSEENLEETSEESLDKPSENDGV